LIDYFQHLTVIALIGLPDLVKRHGTDPRDSVS
jgi:hypothetical protein